MARKAHFHVSGEDFNGTHEATVTVHDTGKTTLVIVRPKHSHEVYTASLAELAAKVVWSDVKRNLQAAHSRRGRGSSH